jgi:type I restriction enzyme S subunit
MLRLPTENTLDREEKTMTEWQTVRLGEIVKTNQSAYSPKENWQFVNYLDTGNITMNKIDEIQYINTAKDKLPSRARRKVKTNSIIYSTVRPNQLHYGIIKEQPDNFLVSTGFTVIDVNYDKAVPDFIYYALTKQEVTEQLQAIAEQSVSAYPSLKPSDIENLEFMLPDKKTQERIVAILRSIDEKIKENNAINNNLYEQMLSIFNNARRTSAWNKHKLSDVLIFFDNLRKPLSSIQREKMAHIYPYYGAASIVDYVEDYLFDGTYILISEDGANVIDSFGHPLTQYTYGKFWVNNHAHIVKGTNGYSEALVYAMLGTLNMQSIVTGAAQPKINQANLRNFEAVLPESEEAQVLSELLNPMLQQILHHEQENEKLSELRDILLPQLMSGALDVSAIDL